MTSDTHSFCSRSYLPDDIEHTVQQWLELRLPIGLHVLQLHGRAYMLP